MSNITDSFSSQISGIVFPWLTSNTVLFGTAVLVFVMWLGWYAYERKQGVKITFDHLEGGIPV